MKFPDVCTNRMGAASSIGPNFPSYHPFPKRLSGLGIGAASGSHPAKERRAIVPQAKPVEIFMVEKVCAGCNIRHAMPVNYSRCGLCTYPSQRFTVAFESVFIPGLKATRKRVGLTQNELGERVGLSQAQISVYEFCEQRVSKRLADALADALGVRLRDLTKRAA